MQDNLANFDAIHHLVLFAAVLVEILDELGAESGILLGLFHLVGNCVEHVGLKQIRIKKSIEWPFLPRQCPSDNHAL